MKLKMARNWFGRIFVVFLLHLVGFRESGPPIFSLFRLCRSSYIAASYAIDDIYGDACKVFSDFSGSIGTMLETKGQDRCN